MSFDEATFDAAQFSGRVRLFPLPNLVMFPHVLQPLHVFEPRYRALMEEALAGDRLIAMAVLAPDWESDYEGRPPLLPHACLGRILTHQTVEGGRYNLLLAGLKRIRIVRELPPEKLFREAEVELIDDEYGNENAAARPALQRSLLESFKQVLPNMPEVHQQLEELLCTAVSLGMLTDLVAYTLKLPIETKAALLGEADVDRRCELLLKRLDEPGTTIQPPSLEGRPVKWPPDFSKN
jgi:ATP-dependent Lon protease